MSTAVASAGVEAAPQRLRVLIVDDEPEISEEIAEFLLRFDVEAICVDRCSAALRALEAGRAFGVMVTDLRMPDMNGIDLLRRVYAPGGIGSETKLKSIVLTGHGTATDISAARDAGAFATLRKPCSLRDLLRTIEAAAEMPLGARPG
ncbi:MAG: response regulator [Bauldia sp.]|nr:response regulator [Bauldia sp.]